MDARGVADRLHVCADAALDQPPAELARGQRLLGEELPHGRGELRRVGAAHAPAERAVVHALDHDLHERSQDQRVAHRDQVDRAAHQRQAHGLALGQHPPELVRVEALDARPEPEVRRQRFLRLEADEELHDVGHRRGDALEQQLPLEQRSIERAPLEDLGRHCTELFSTDPRPANRDGGAMRRLNFLAGRTLG